MAIDMTMALCRSLADTNCSGKRTIDTRECALCEPCASGPFKTPKLHPCKSTSEKDEEDEELVDEDDDEEEEDEAAALDTADTDPVSKGSMICVSESCGKYSTWGPIGGPKNSARLCAPHGKAYGGCENVKSKRCAEPGCKSTSPKFGPVGGVSKDATHCSGHGKPRGFVDIVNPRCDQPGCDKHAVFGEPGGKRIRCGDHREDYVDIVSAKCDQPGCDTRATFGEPGGKLIRCGDHREDYVDLVSKLCQHADGCLLHPSYGVPGGRPLFCAEHRDTRTHEDVKHPRCVTCRLLPKKFRHPKSKTKECNECDPAIYSVPGKQKEAAVKAVLEAAFPDMVLHREMHVDFCGHGADRTACGKNPALRARCDFVLETVLEDGAVVQVEVDEHAHRHYCPADEIIRTQSIVTALHEGHNHRHVHVVRFNPDAFKIGEKTKTVSLKTRYAELVKVIKAAFASNKPKDTWSLQYMYYDCDNDGKNHRLCIMDEIHPIIRDIVCRSITHKYEEEKST